MRQPIWLRRPSGFKLTDLAGKRLLFYHDFALAPRQAVTKPVVGSAGSFMRGTTRPYFDQNGNYRIASVNELIFTKSPSGLLLPMISPAAKNLVLNNSSDGPTAGYQRVKLSGNVSWADGQFQLGRYAASANAGEHRVSLMDITSGIAAGVWCASAVYKPTGGSQSTARMLWEAYDGSSYDSVYVLINLVSGNVTLGSETARWKPLKAGRVALPGGYYYIFFAAYLKDATGLISLKPFVYLIDASGNSSFTGDGTTELALIGAHCVFDVTNPVIYPPAPIRTTGSTVTVAQDVLSFPFGEKLPAEGVTAHFECEVGITTENFILGQQFLVGNVNELPTGRYSPFGFRVGSVTCSLVLDNTTTGTGPLTSTTARTSLQLTATETRIYRDGSLVVTNAEAHDLGTSNPLPAAIEFKVNQYTPVWLRRYALVKGIVDPKLLLT